MSQSFRRKGLAEFGDAIRWLASELARNSYEYALQHDNEEHYGLNPTTVRAIERHKIESIDVLVLADDKDWILFFSHENEIEYGHHRDLRRQ